LDKKQSSIREKDRVNDMSYVRVETELEAINISLDMWAFLKSTGEDKDDYLLGIEQRYLAGCALCQFYIKQDDTDQQITSDKYYYRTGCRNCCLFPAKLCNFATHNSAFSKWDNADSFSEQKKKYASIIYNAILKRKKQLEATV